MMMISARFTKACVAAALTMLSIASQATTLTFEDTGATGQFQAMPAGYGGLTWANTGVLNVKGYQGNPSGYEAGVVSGSRVGFSNGAFGMSFSASAPFTFNSLYGTAAWNDGLSVVVTGSLNGSTLFSQTLSPSATAPTLYTFNWTGIDTVSFSSFGGTAHAGYPGTGTHFAFDNLTINEPVTPFTPAIPEPQTYVLMAACLAVVAGVTRRSRQGQPRA